MGEYAMNADIVNEAEQATRDKSLPDKNSIYVRPAQISDLDNVEAVYASARKYMADNGNPNQWGTSYPSRELLESDISKKQLYVCYSSNEHICGVFVLALGDDPTYAKIYDGEWLSDEPYATIHRIASDGTERGILDACLKLAQSTGKQLRADTHADNLMMQHALEKHGFVHCGTIYVADGTPRLAYQRI